MFGGFTASLKKEFQGYSTNALFKDVMAGLTVAAVALPLALAFGVSSGATAGAGLITSIIAGTVTGLLSGGYYQISGPTGSMAVILTTVAINFGMEGIFIVTFLAGIMRLFAGLLRLGTLTAFIPGPVITGFTSGIAIIIASGQIDNFFGVSSEGSTALERIMSYRHLGFSVDMTVLAIGLFVVLFMVIFPKKWNAIVPASLLSIIITTAAAIMMNIDIPVVGEIPKTLFPPERFALSSLNLKMVTILFPAAISIAILGMIETLLCGATAGRMTGVKLNNNQELIAQGIGNMIIPFFGGIPSTAAIARSSVAIKSGAQTRLTCVFHSIGLLISMFILGSVMSKIPLASLAGVLMVTAWRTNEWQNIRYMLSHKFKGAILEFFATMLATILFDLTVAILIGVLIGLIFLVTRLSRIEINYEEVDMARMGVTDENLCNRYKNALVVYITGPMIFANTERVEEILVHVNDYDTILLSMRGVSNIDISCAQIMLDHIALFHKRGVDVVLCGLPKNSMKMLHRSEVYDAIGEKNFYWSVERALLDLRPVPKCTLADDPILDD